MFRRPSAFAVFRYAARSLFEYAVLSLREVGLLRQCPPPSEPELTVFYVSSSGVVSSSEQEPITAAEAFRVFGFNVCESCPTPEGCVFADHCHRESKAIVGPRWFA